MVDGATSTALPRQAAELILQDERLTADLEDDEADALLRWALAAVEQAVTVRLQCGQPLDGAAIAEAVRPVRQVSRAINDLVAGYGGMGRRDLLDRLLALIDSARRLPPTP
jgi:hypothetical protein